MTPLADQRALLLHTLTAPPAVTRLQALPSRLTSRNSRYDKERETPGAVEPRPPGTTARQPGTTQPENHLPANISGQ